MEALRLVNEKILWGIPMLSLMLFTGIYLLIATRGAVFVHFGFMIKNTVCTLFKKKETTDGISPFAAVSTALAATVGTGNITGVALAVRLGGPGAVFWMWVSGFLGMVIKYTEVTLAVRYREKTKDGYAGGPMYYMTKGLSSKSMACVFCFFAVLSSFGIGNMVQANSFAGGMEAVFDITPKISGIILCILCFAVLAGGIKRISSVSEALVPVMAVLYMTAAAAVIIINIDKLPECFSMIVKSAFSDMAPVGGFAGAACMYAARIGVSRGLFTNEAGLGSAPIAHASADTKHPVLQGMWGAFEVFFDTIVMCSMTAVVIIVSGVWKGGGDNARLAHIAFSQNIPKGGYVVSFGLIIFAFASIIAWYYYGESCVKFLFKGRGTRLYRLFYVAACYLGCISEIKFIWETADALNALMMLPNLAALLLLGAEAGKITRDFFKK